MIIKKLILENFRNYKNRTEININKDMTVFIGKNDIGKSTVLEALDIFFNGKDAVVKFSKDDHTITNSGGETIIGVVFENFPENIILDTSVQTTLTQEYLLNKNGLLEIHKKYTSGNEKETYIICQHPNNDEHISDLLSKKITELKTIVDDKGLTCTDRRVASELRRTIRESYGIITCDTKHISIKEEGAKNIRDQINIHMPIFALFQSDRPNKDKDNEVQDPLKLTIQEILKDPGIIEQLNTIADEIKTRTREVTEATLGKLNEMNPEIASELHPSMPDNDKLKRNSVFSAIEIMSDGGVPLNKRGSGVRRLVLINFFRAQAEKRKNLDNKTNIIYAIEEPETSQHPDHQKKLRGALMELSEANNTQILLTTHSPALAQLVPRESINLIEKDGDNMLIKNNDDSIYLKIATELGILPTLSKIVICVEGNNDITFLSNINKGIEEFKNIIDLSNFSIIPMHGSNLKVRVQQHYLQHSNIVEFHLYDKDPDNQYSAEESIINARGDGSHCKITNKREMENYIPKTLVEEKFQITINESLNYNEIDLPKTILDSSPRYEQARTEGGESQKKAISQIKQIMNGTLSKQIQKEMLSEDDFDEIKSRFEKIAEMYQSCIQS